MTVEKTATGKADAYKAANKLTRALLIIYLIVLYWILLFKLGVRFAYMKSRSVNFIPFREPLIINGKADVGELILNIVIFVPLGLYAGMLFNRWSFGKQFLFFLLMSLIVESLQYLLAVGAFDSTDIITNTFGGIIGLLVFKATESICNSSTKAQTLINKIAATGTALMILLLLLLKLNMLPVRYQ